MKLKYGKPYQDGHLFELPYNKIDEIFKNGYTYLVVNGKFIKVTLDDIRISKEDVEKMEKELNSK